MSGLQVVFYRSGTDPRKTSQHDHFHIFNVNENNNAKIIISSNTMNPIAFAIISVKYNHNGYFSKSFSPT